NSWRNGYMIIACIQIFLVLVLILSLPLWKRVSRNSNTALEEVSKESLMTNHVEVEKGIKPIQVKGVKLALVSFLFYCGAEATMNLWGSSYLVNIKGLNPATAAAWVSFYFAGITIGRFVTG